MQDRRHFLQAVSGLAAVGVVGSFSRLVSAADATPKTRLSLAAYSYRQLLTAKTNPLTLTDFINDCAAMKIEGTELTSYYFPNPVTNEYLLKLKQQCAELKLAVSGTAVGNDFGHPAGEKRQQQIELVKRWVDHSKVLGAPVIRIFAGHTKPGSNDAEAHSLMVAGMEECCDYAAKHGVKLALENHGGPTATADGLLKFVKDVKSPAFGVNLDTGNFSGADVYDQIEKVAPYAVNAQVKVSFKGTGGKREVADFGRVAKILRKVNYTGFVVLEYEEPGEPRAECPKIVEQLRQAFA